MPAANRRSTRAPAQTAAPDTDAKRPAASSIRRARAEARILAAGGRKLPVILLGAEEARALELLRGGGRTIRDVVGEALLLAARPLRKPAPGSG